MTEAFYLQSMHVIGNNLITVEYNRCLDQRTNFVTQHNYTELVAIYGWYGVIEDVDDSDLIAVWKVKTIKN